MKTALVLIACVALFASAAHLTSASAGTPPGLTVSYSGKAFEGGGNGDAPPPMRIEKLRPGGAVSGTVTVRNPGPGWRWFWLSQADVADRLGDAGGRLSDTVLLSVLDVSRVNAPASVYRGPAMVIGARPLGFLAPGAGRTYSFTADLPANAPHARVAGAYRGARTDISYAWRAIPGAPPPPPVQPRRKKAAPPAKRKARDTSAPQVKFSASKNQSPLRTGALSIRARCNEACRLEAEALVIGPDARWTAVAQVGPGGLRRYHAITVRLGPKALGTVRRALLSRRIARVRVTARARDKAGNRGSGRYTLRLLPRS